MRSSTIVSLEETLGEKDGVIGDGSDERALRFVHSDARRGADFALSTLLGDTVATELAYVTWAENLTCLKDRAERKVEAVEGLLSDYGLLQKNFTQPHIDKTSHNGVFHSYFPVGAGDYHGIGIVVMHKQMVDVDDPVYDPDLEESVPGVENQYLAVRATAVASQLCRAQSYIKPTTASRLVEMQTAAYRAGLVR